MSSLLQRSLSIVLLCTPVSNAIAVDIGSAMPSEFKVQSMSDKNLGVDQLSGKVTVINFWATWCAACKVELKEMSTMLAPLAKQEGVQLAFVSLDKEPKLAQDWLASNLQSADFILNNSYKDPEFAAAELLEVDSFPMTLIIDQNNKVRYVQKGFEEGKGHTEKLVEQVKALAQNPK